MTPINWILSRDKFPKRVFDPKSKVDLQVYRDFLKNNGWGGPCPFVLEQPFLSIPHMIADKIARSQVETV